jgi:CRISPR-associated protein Csx10
MKKIKYQIRTLDPIIISSESGNQFMVPTKDYVPGINILGALAAKYIQQNNLGNYFNQQKPDDANFLDWFINGKVNFSNAYKTDKIDGNEYVTYPLPFSIQHLKNDESKIFDLLYEESSEQTKAFNGFGLLKDLKLYKTKINKSTDPHHERDYTTGAPKQNVFFNYESIDANQTFEGTIYGDDNCIEEFYKQFSDLLQLRIGRSKTSEYGKIQLSLSQPENQSEDNIVPNEDETISLTFFSNVILYDKNGSTSCSMQTLEEYLKEKISGISKIKKAFLRTEEIENYVSVWKLKKPSEVSFQAGSCLLLKVKASDIETMKKLQSDGIGERRNEGFGQITFGLQRMRITKAEFEKEVSKSPTLPVPELVKKKTFKIVEEYLKKISAVEALKIVSSNSKGLNKKISSSQISKLEGICRISDSDKTFKKKIDSLRKISKEQLISCRFDKSNLFDFLTKENILNNSDIRNEITKMGTLFTDVGIELTKIEEITPQLYRAYYLILFAAMRKAIKGGQK